jgi:hypothetical protein
LEDAAAAGNGAVIGDNDTAASIAIVRIAEIHSFFTLSK